MKTITVQVSDDGYKLWTSLSKVYEKWAKGNGRHVPPRELATALMTDMLTNFTEKIARDTQHLVQHPEDCVSRQEN